MANINRRDFALATAAACALPRLASGQPIPRQEKKFEYCAFIKFLQSLSHEQLADALVSQGFDGGEVTVRKGGYISADRAATELPKLHRAFEKQGLKINIITTDVMHPKDKHAETTLKTAASLGIPFYRMGFYRYDLAKPILPQLASFQSPFQELATLNRKTGISAVYQNHSGAKYLGATFWDLQRLLKDIPREEIGSIFDIRHAAVEGGLAWPIYFDLIKPHISAFSIKDFKWEGRRSVHTPFGKGNVSPQFFEMVKKSFDQALFTVHVEYLKRGEIEKNKTALGNDLKALRALLE